MTVGADMAVKLTYRLFDEAGEQHDEITKREPLSYVHGYAQIIPGLELGIEGARVGDRRTLHLQPDEAFGEYDAEARCEIDRNDFPDAERASIGDELICTAPDGSECAYRIVEISESDILAEVEVLSIRKATDEELVAAMADMDERIVYADSIGYATEPDEEENHGAPEPPLVQLRRNPNAGSTP